MDGTQSPGINYNSIDGLTTVNATTISINGSTINLANYIPYVGSVQAPDFNGKQLRNIAVGTLGNDVAAVSQIPSITGLVPYTLAVSNVDLNGKQLKNIADGTLVQDAITLSQLNAKRYDTIQNGAADVYVNCGLNDLTLQAGPIGKIEIGSLIDCNSNTITNLGAAVNPGDAVRLDQLPAALPAATVQGSYIIYNGSAYINNATNSINLGGYSNATATSSVNIGQYAGFGNTSANSHNVNIGQSTGSSGQNSQIVAVGSNAGATNQGVGSVAIGYRSQRTNTVGGYGSVSVGSLAGANDVGNNCVGVGGYAGYQSQSNNAVAIGFQAGYSNQHSNSIIINATGNQLNSGASAATYIAPLRSLVTDNSLYYNTTTKEVSYIADSAYWSIFSNVQLGGILGAYCFVYTTDLPALGLWGNLLLENYTANVNTNFGTAVWENPSNPKTRDITVTIPYNGIYQINVSCGAQGPVGEYIIYIRISSPSAGVKAVKVIDFYGVTLNQYENASWAGTYYFEAATMITLVSDSVPVGLVAQASFSGHLVRRT